MKLKHLATNLTTLFVSLLTTIGGNAQHQRLAIAPTSFTLSPNGTTQKEAFCLDHHLYADEELAPYDHVISGSTRAYVRLGRSSARIPLEKAIASNLVSVKGGSGNGARERFATGIGLEFTNETSKTLTIEVFEPLAVGEHPGGVEVPLDSLKSNKSHPTAVQRDLWESGTPVRQLRMLNYLDDAGFTVPKLKSSVLDFQRGAGITETGLIDAETKRALNAKVLVVQQQLEAVGFPINKEESVPDLSSALNDFKRYKGIIADGRLDPHTSLLISEDLTTLAEVKSALTPGPEIKPQAHQPIPPVVVTQAGALGLSQSPVSAALTVTANKPETWMFSGEEVTRYDGDDAIFLWNAVSGSQAMQFTDDNNVVVHFGRYKKGESGVVQMGAASMEFSPDGRSFTEFFGNPSVKQQLTDFANSSNGKPRLIVYRDPAFTVSGGQIPGFEQVDPQEIAHAARKVLGDRFIVGVANDAKLGVENAANVPRFKSGSQIRVIVDGENKGDFNTVANVSSALKDANIEIVEASQTGGGDAKIFIFAEHNSERFRGRVTEMAKAGQFKDGIIATAVCGIPTEMDLNSQLIRDSGARAVIYYPMEVEARAVQRTLLKFSELLQTHGAEDGDFPRIWNQSVDEAAADAGSDNMRDSLDQLRRSVIQFSEVRRKGDSTNGI